MARIPRYRCAPDMSCHMIAAAVMLLPPWCCCCVTVMVVMLLLQSLDSSSSGFEIQVYIFSELFATMEAIRVCFSRQANVPAAGLLLHSQVAVQAHLWGVALCLANSCGERAISETATQMAYTCMVPGTPLRTMVLMLAGGCGAFRKCVVCHADCACVRVWACLCLFLVTQTAGRQQLPLQGAVPPGGHRVH